MTSRERLGGIIHSYQKYDPVSFPSPTAPPPDMVSSAFDHMLAYGDMRRLTPEELARAVKIDPSQIQGLGPSIDALIAMLEERKRKILATYETDGVRKKARGEFSMQATETEPPKQHRKQFRRAVREEQIHDLEQLWYQAGDERSPFAKSLLHLMEALGNVYQIDELASKYAFTGHEAMTVPQALRIKEELEAIDKLLKQLEEARETAQIGVIDLEELSQFAEPGDMQQLEELRAQVENYMREQAERQGLEFEKGAFRLTPKAYRVFQGKLLEQIFSDLTASRSGRHEGPVIGEGAVETQRTKDYEFGDSVTHMDVASSMVNAMLRDGPSLPIRLKGEDIVIHKTRNNPKCATVVLLDMSGSMRYGGQYINVKRMGLALEGLIRSEFPGDYLRFLEMYTFAKPRHPSELAELMPKPVTIFDPVVRLKADMSDPEISEWQIPPHFTNIQHGLQLGRQFLASTDTPNRQIIIITDGLPTAHFEGEMLYLLYPPHPETEEATMREGRLCAREGITINMFLLQSWNQTREDIQFAYKLSEGTKGRVIFTAGHDLDRFVVWDYLNRRKTIIG
ncbi:hypothetical protein Pan216_02380 [Planctomycetes bacterium Pan216]|uniref:VWFA domain-containing protein n=1 Tax=Kolteria novifilia TaxID=2527975 RepID=A0A518AXK4_9BACT|nr:hypothetical protein Pan216_02380 [Planctomycetes bacterium Pan216]